MFVCLFLRENQKKRKCSNYFGTLQMTQVSAASVASVTATQDSEVNILRKNKDKGDTEGSVRKSN